MSEAAPTEPRLLLVDDNPTNLNVLCELLETRGYNISIALSGRQALEIAAASPPDLVLLDVMMPEIDGYEVCRRLKANAATREIPVVFITAKDLEEGVVQGFEAGGVDYITKPFYEREVIARVETHLRVNQLSRQLAQQNALLQDKIEELEQSTAQRQALKGQLSLISEREAAHWGLEGFVGQSPTIRRIFDEIRLMQENAATTVLINGESGTGKELIARAVHFGSARRDGPFVPVNCAAFPGELVESLLFGHLKGAFTGAHEDRMGYYEMADGGTLFLDEIGEMPLELQAKLLRVLEDGKVQRVGAQGGRQVDVRVVAATNVDLQRQIQKGIFRQDLYYRLARFTVTAPPLRERQDDIPLLAQHFLQIFSREMGRESPGLSEQAQATLCTHAFPGNVRELKNIIERGLIESRGGQVEPHHLHFAAPTADGSAPGGGTLPALPDNLDDAVTYTELWVVKRAMDRTHGNIAETARLLGTNRNRIYRVLGQDKDDAGG